MRTILISISAEHNANIESGRKSAELRTRPPKCELPIRVLTYESGKHGRHKVTNEWICRDMREYKDGDYPSSLSPVSCVPMSYINEYTDNCRKKLTVMYITDLKVYDKPRELSEFYVEGDCDCMNCKKCYWFDKGNGYDVEDDCNLAYKGADLHKSFKPITRPPQSWMYVEVEK